LLVAMIRVFFAKITTHAYSRTVKTTKCLNVLQQ